MHRILTKTQLLSLLEQRLVQSGIAVGAAQDSARVFLSELEGGAVLKFSDLGEVGLHADTATLRPLPQPAPGSAAPWQSAAAPAGTTPYTLAAEASIRRLMRGGYARRDAEVALSQGARARVVVTGASSSR